MLKSSLLIATNNEGKLKEYQALLAATPFPLIGLAQAGIHQTVEETGATFEENALLKAKTYASLSGLLTLADDSGLEVDALGGEPGVRSSRYAGPNATDPQRVEYLLAKLKDVPYRWRTARFRCVIALVWPSGEIEMCQGMCPGMIAMEPRGANGFGYDPVFFLPHLKRTMAELTLEEKNQVSHRAMAARAALALLKQEAARHNRSNQDPRGQGAQVTAGQGLEAGET